MIFIIDALQLWEMEYKINKKETTFYDFWSLYGNFI